MSIILSIWSFSIFNDHSQRRDYYNRALRKSRETKKPLLVIGDPTKGMSCKWLGVVYGTGDICIDLEPSLGSSNVLKAEAIEFLSNMKSNSAIIYVSCVLEYVPKIDTLIKEIERVAGDCKNIYLVHTKFYSPVSYLYHFENDKSLHVITQAPPTHKKIKYFTL